MKIYKLAQHIQQLDNFEGSAPSVDWNETDNYGIWNRVTVANFFNVAADEHIYRGMVDMSDLSQKVVEYEDAANIRNGQDDEEAKELYYEQAKDILDHYNKNKFYDSDLNEEWGDFLTYDYDEDDIMGLAREILARERGSWDIEDMGRSFGNTKYPPIVITREVDGSFVVNDGNHRVETWKKQGYDVAPAWINDKLRRDMK